MNGAELSNLYLSNTIDCLVSYTRQSDLKYDHKIQGKKRTWKIQLEFNDNFPYSLPFATLLDKDQIGLLPHVNQHGTICYAEHDGILINYSDPENLLDYIISTIRNHLDRWSLKIFKDDLKDEYEGFFFNPLNEINSFCCPQSTYSRIYIKTKYNKDKTSTPVLMYEKNSPLPEKFSDIQSTSELNITSALCVNFNTKITPPIGGNFTFRYFKSLIDSLDEKEKARVTRLAQKFKNKLDFFVLLSAPRNSLNRTQILLKFKYPAKNEHPIVSDNEKCEISLFSILRLHKKYLLERGGAISQFQNSKVAIVGCGSVGSEIASMISKSGVGSLTLIDHDEFNADNIYRHNLGGNSITFTPDSSKEIKKNFKVDALKKSIEKDIPYIRVNAVAMTFQHAIKQNLISNFDVIIVAIGSPTENLQANRLLKNTDNKIIIYCWNEAAGAGGHSVKIDMAQCCLECIYINEGGEIVPTYYSLLASDQNIAKNLTGCAGLFTPFSYIDSSQTALLATKHCLEALHSITESSISSWKNDRFDSYMVTDYFSSFSHTTEHAIIKSDSCGICNG
ncbi:ThiF family adenylyltransferase [Shewanella salipaludis]|uniref:THIF-type NAD/FAD binding fold domain-containing protein n=1 Tax=Shewanella salipaludis TaxID=2723052 RepID=A0A972G4T8_9GAMM|nr:ThiF family adenylyltransferase [Shewanella salipaludis]NMH64455.1 hypothetical protein [Shewanella salipaludis]